MAADPIATGTVTARAVSTFVRLFTFDIPSPSVREVHSLRRTPSQYDGAFHGSHVTTRARPLVSRPGCPPRVSVVTWSGAGHGLPAQGERGDVVGGGSTAYDLGSVDALTGEAP
ncbi:hypothetical protein GCM10009810_35700 [Nostocoides vanveenii]|uniref:Uncharacterized protein n=1 Tax=Nostocoides vanveenii TaxID=330835 RepID=A0ABN2L5Q0_9MICO